MAEKAYAHNMVGRESEYGWLNEGQIHSMGGGESQCVLLNDCPTLNMDGRESMYGWLNEMRAPHLTWMIEKGGTDS